MSSWNVAKSCPINYLILILIMCQWHSVTYSAIQHHRCAIKQVISSFKLLCLIASTTHLYFVIDTATAMFVQEKNEQIELCGIGFDLTHLQQPMAHHLTVVCFPNLWKQICTYLNDFTRTSKPSIEITQQISLTWIRVGWQISWFVSLCSIS